MTTNNIEKAKAYINNFHVEHDIPAKDAFEELTDVLLFTDIITVFFSKDAFETRNWDCADDWFIDVAFDLINNKVFYSSNYDNCTVDYANDADLLHDLTALNYSEWFNRAKNAIANAIPADYYIA